MFTLDVAEFNVNDYFLIYFWGLQRFIMGENVEPPDLSDILLKEPSGYFKDIKWAM